jgi:hypothetical protein
MRPSGLYQWGPRRARNFRPRITAGNRGNCPRWSTRYADNEFDLSALAGCSPQAIPNKHKLKEELL